MKIRKNSFEAQRLKPSKVEKIYHALKRRIAILRQAVKSFFGSPRLYEHSAQHFSTQPPAQDREIHTRQVAKMHCSTSEAAVSPKPRNEVNDIYAEHQVEGEQTCGTHSANTFFGKHVLDQAAPKKAQNADDLFKRMKAACQEAKPEDNLPAAAQLVLHDTAYGQPLLEALENLKSDRIVLFTGMATHYVSCMRGESGQWYVVDSAKRGEAIKDKVDSPAAYLRRLYHGWDINQLDMQSLSVAIINMEGDELPGMETH